MKKLLFISIAAFTTFSCSVTSFREKTSDSLEINKGTIQQTSKIAEYRVDTEKKIKGAYSGSYEQLTGTSDTEFAKQMAIANAIEMAKCDFLVNPLYDVNVVGNNISVSVIGYAAFYTSFTTIRRNMVQDTNK